MIKHHQSQPQLTHSLSQSFLPDNNSTSPNKLSSSLSVLSHPYMTADNNNIHVVGNNGVRIQVNRPKNSNGHLQVNRLCVFSLFNLMINNISPI